MRTWFDRVEPCSRTQNRSRFAPNLTAELETYASPHTSIQPTMPETPLVVSAHLHVQGPLCPEVSYSFPSRVGHHPRRSLLHEQLPQVQGLLLGWLRCLIPLDKKIKCINSSLGSNSSSRRLRLAYKRRWVLHSGENYLVKEPTQVVKP